MSVLRFLFERAITELDFAIAHLLIGAIFFAMRSCEYLKTCSEEESKRTKILRLKNFTFIKSGKILPLKSRRLDTANLVRIQFEFQKNDKRDQSVHMYRSGDKILCPVRAWGHTFYRLLKTIPDVSEETKVCEFYFNGKSQEINSNMVRSKLRATVDLLGEGILGFTKDDVGLHSIRSGGAMAMFLSGVSEIIIKRVGRWSSEAFLEYIREQVDTFTVGVSRKMLKNEKFHHLNEKELELEYDSDKDGQYGDGESNHIPYTVHYSKQVIQSKFEKSFKSTQIS